jgi:hypothetical protein
MANEILLLDSFDRYAAAAPGHVGSVWSTNGAVVSGRFFGGKAVEFYSNANGGARSYRYTPSFNTQACMGSAVMLTARDAPIFTMSRASGTNPLTLWVDATGRLCVYAGTGGAFGPGGTLLASGNSIDRIVPGAWHYIEFAASVGPDGAQILRAWVDGALALEATNISTYNNTGMDSFGLAFEDQAQVYDDFYVKNGLTPLGELKIETLDLIGDTLQADFAVNGGGAGYDKLDEPTVDNDASYISSNVVGAKSIFQVANLTATPEVIKALQVRTYARKEDAGYRVLRALLQSGGNEYLGSNNVLATSYKHHMDIFERNPNGGLVWSEAAVNALQVGIKLEA